MLGAGELASLRAASEMLFSATAVVLRRTQVADTSGGFVNTYAAVATYPCSFSPHQITPVERQGTIQVQTVVSWRFVFPSGSDIRSTDRLTVGSRAFEVVSSGAGSLEISLPVLCQEIT